MPQTSPAKNENEDDERFQSALHDSNQESRALRVVLLSAPRTASLRYYIRNEDEKMPPADRFNPGQKLLFLGLFRKRKLITGLILWLPQDIPWNLNVLRLISVFPHSVCALFTIALFIIHIYMGTAMERGAFGSVIRGDVSHAWADHHHHGWFQQVVRDESGTAVGVQAVANSLDGK
jgi:cytochrome b subunit of formate dehydrogenase